MLGFDQVSKLLLYSFKNESELEKSIFELSQLFNFKRDQLDLYLDDERLVSAYTLFYGLTNFPKFQKVLNLLGIHGPDIMNKNFIDIGSGPGIFSCAYLFLNPNVKSVYLVEKSTLMKKQAKKIIEFYFPEVKIHFDHKSYVENSVSFFGHSFNEMTLQTAKDYLHLFKSEHVFLIEPGTKNVFKRMLDLRQNLLEEAYEIRYPCLSSLNCPLKDSDKDWCHQYVEVIHETKLEKLCQKLKLDRRILPLTIHLYQRNGRSSTPSTQTARVIRSHLVSKFSYEFEICQINDGENQTMRIQFLKKNLSKSEKNYLDKISSGECISFEIEKQMDSLLRVKFISQT